MQRGVIAVLDIGTFKVAALILKIDESRCRPRDRAWAPWPGRRGSG
jgi:hypothetical protein